LRAEIAAGTQTAGRVRLEGEFKLAQTRREN